MNRRETCVESEVLSFGIGEYFCCMSPVSIINGLLLWGLSRAVIVLDWVDNTSGVSVLMVRPVAGEGCPRGW
jgi:hypothetical protein